MSEVQTSALKRDGQNAREPRGKLRPARDLVEYFREYTRENPGLVALACIGIGIVLGWKLKP